MPSYTYVGDAPAILIGLSQGVNADHIAAPGNPEIPAGSTIVAAHGDVVDTRDLEYLVVNLTADPPAPDTPADPPAVDYTVAPAPAPNPITL